MKTLRQMLKYHRPVKSNNIRTKSSTMPKEGCKENQNK